MIECVNSRDRRNCLVPEVFCPPADSHQVLGGDLAAVGLLVQAGQRLQRVKHHLAGPHDSGGGVRADVLEEVIAGAYT